jgi:hypothetical protein
MNMLAMMRREVTEVAGDKGPGNMRFEAGVIFLICGVWGEKPGRGELNKRVDLPVTRKRETRGFVNCSRSPP